MKRNHPLQAKSGTSQIPSKLSFAEDMQIHAGETSIDIDAIPILPFGIERAANSISEDPEHSTGFTNPDTAIVNMHNESTLRFERAGDVLKYGKTILASLHHTDRTVQTGRKIKTRVA
jgi:hypothetical protein